MIDKKIEYIPAKTILNPVKWGDDWFGNDYMINLYRGCNHNCIYCYSRSEIYGIDNFTKVSPKENAIKILQKQASSKRKKGIVGLGAMSDTYNYLDKNLMYTRDTLKILNMYGFGVSIETKSTLVTRDIDILKQINDKKGAIIKISITTSSDKLSKKIEIGAPLTSERFKAMKKLSDNGLFVGTLLLPIIPYITDDINNIKEIIRLIAENGGKFVQSKLFLTLQDRQRDYFFSKLDELFPNLKKQYIREFGNVKQIKRNTSMLEKIIEQECKKYGLLYNMKDIIKAYKKEEIKYEQLSLF